ncbi:MAG: hypothetical protein IK001_05290 [Lachnospiraceae bacterium]|nr:hypothetical protein [Lachnospiraceae bacterium]
MEKNVKRIRAGTVRRAISVLTVLLLLCSVLISCSKKSPPDDTQTDQTAAATSGDTLSPTPAPTGPPLKASGEVNMQAVLKKSAAVVYLTINPELAIYVDANNIVISADCLNDDAKEAYSDISFSGKSLDECTRQVIEAAIEHEYLTEDKEVKVDIAVLDESTDCGAILEKTRETVNETTAEHNMTVNVVAAEVEQHGKILCDECLGSGKCIYCDTCPPCEMCHGTGTKLCDWCEEGLMICPACGGNTETEQFITATVTTEVEFCKACGHMVSETDVTCPACKGTGKNPCHMCGGVGRTFCTECGGKGGGISDKTKEWVNCGRCGGTGLKHCNECDGTGYEPGTCPIYCNHPGDRHEFRTATVEMEIDNPNWCTYCLGRGKDICNVCGGDYAETCPACGGTGTTPCGMCTENGAHKKGVCSKCLGTGYMDPGNIQ